MMITFEALEKALAPIAEVGQQELTFDLGGTLITLSGITPEQDIEVTRFANEALSTDESMPNTADWATRFKLALLSHAIVAVGDQDLRGVETIATGETLPNGVPLRLPKAQAMRKLLSRWTESVRNLLLRKYGELLVQLELKSDKLVQFDFMDLDAEIANLEGRLSSLKNAREQAQAKETTEIANMVKTLVKIDSQDREDSHQLVDQFRQTPVQDAKIDPSAFGGPPQAPKGPRQSVLPDRATPPPPRAQEPVQRVQEPTPAPQEYREPHQSLGPVNLPEEDSFIDPSDEEGFAAAMQLENRRMAELRGNRLNRPPHLAAQEVVLEPEQIFNPAPAEEYTGPLPQRSIPPVNVGSKSINPRFQPPKRS